MTTRRIVRTVFCAVAALAFIAPAIVAPAWAKTVHSLGQVPGQLTSPEAKSYWAQQMVGKKGPDGLGVRLPSALTAPAIIDLLRPAGDHAKPTLVGAKPWPEGGKDRYAAIVCTGGAAFDPDDPVCAEGDANAPPLKLYLGVIAARPGTAPHLIARLGPVAGKVDWDLTDMPAPDDLGDGTPQRFERFDLARYRIAPGEAAFGLRVGWMYGYSGGGSNYSALLLFAIERGVLHQMLAAPMSVYRNIAGDWHADGTRDHDITDESNLLIVSRNRTAGHFDLIAKARHWNPVKRAWMEIVGIGIDYRIAKAGIVVQSVIVGGPAAEARIAPGDVIVAIDGHPVAGLAARALKARMNGVVGGPVRLTLRRDRHPPFEITLRRALITQAPSPHLDYKWSGRAGAYRAASCTAPCL
ncbi:MAG: PDZ domain-containing protein [Stellaceae bacterium]